MRLSADIHLFSQPTILGFVKRCYRLYSENRHAHREMLQWLGYGR